MGHKSRTRDAAKKGAQSFHRVELECASRMEQRSSDAAKEVAQIEL